MDVVSKLKAGLAQLNRMDDPDGLLSYVIAQKSFELHRHVGCIPVLTQDPVVVAANDQTQSKTSSATDSRHPVSKTTSVSGSRYSVFAKNDPRGAADHPGEAPDNEPSKPKP